MERGTDLENVYDTMGRCLADIHREGVRQSRLLAAMERSPLSCCSQDLVRSVTCLLFREIEGTVASLGDPAVAEASFFVAHFNYLCRCRINSSSTLSSSQD